MIAKTLFFGVLVSVLFSPPTMGNSLDPTFGSGIVNIEVDGAFDDLMPKAIATDENGNVVVVGVRRPAGVSQGFISFLMSPSGDIRYNFGIDMFSGLFHEATSVLSDSRSRVLVGGVVTLPIKTCDSVDKFSSFSFVTRFDSADHVDNSFGVAGSFAGTAFLQSPCDDATEVFMALDSLGRILLVSNVSGEKVSVVVARFTSDGKLDKSFGTQGQVRLESLSAGEWLESTGFALSNADEIVVATNQTSPADLSKMGAIFKLDSNGMLDLSFGVDGVFGLHSGHPNSICCVSADSAGNVYFAGTSDGDAVFIGRLTTSGVLDTRFAGTGRDFVSVGSTDVPVAIRLDAKGRPTLTLNSFGLRAGHTGVELMHFDSDGSLNAALGDSGIYEQSCGFVDCWANAMAIDSLGRPLLVVGTNGNGTFVLREDEMFADGFD